MSLETLDPDSDDAAPDAADLDPAVLDALGAADYRFKVWGGDWCIDCQRQLPAFGAALAAAGVPDDRIEDFPVTKSPEGKEGEGVDEYDIELIPTVVVESPAGDEVARFVEDADVSIAEFLATRLADAEASA
ncbi:thioredoxin [Halorubrum sp. PV6]|uniref:thioredoxin n=1 Tax=Halorubrum sp. PV6 TaxID=634157 RepID=UPI000F851955|nr:thioredoxin [Halorubrum sp. PV6]AZQ14507.1 thioredoxin [Halorubrum sp. PV6]